MAERPKFGEYVLTVLRRSMVSYHGADVWFAIAAYFTILILPLIATGVVEDFLGELTSKLIALIATGWLVLLFFVVTPFRIWQDNQYQLRLVDESGQPKIRVAWRFKNPSAELYIENISSKTINDVTVSFRNFRNADGTELVEILRSLISRDGRTCPMSLDPLVPTYFEFARLKTPKNDPALIAFMPDTDKETRKKNECYVKIGISGKDIPNNRVDLSISIKNECELVIESANDGEDAVGIFKGD